MRRTLQRTLVLAALGGATPCLAPQVASAQYEEDLWVDTGDETPRPRARRASPASGGGLTLGQIRPSEIPATYSVRRGDTLWAITGHFYGNPYDWPRVWSYNPEITNPHWIYPDQSVRLLAEGAGVTVSAPRQGGQGPSIRRGVETGTVFLRERGWLDDEALETAGEIVGSPDDHMMLSPFDQAYVRFDQLPDGQTAPEGEYTVFRELEADERGPGEEGTVVRILGTVRVDSWNSERKMARVTVLEALDPIERGYQVAAIPRRFDVVPPQRAEVDLDTTIVASLDARELMGEQQIVFVPVGEEDGVRVGNRLFVVRAGDAWRDDLAPAQAQAASVDLPAEPEEYPDEVIAEARVVATRASSAALLVTRAARPVSIGDRAQIRSGY